MAVLSTVGAQLQMLTTDTGATPLKAVMCIACL